MSWPFVISTDGVAKHLGIGKLVSREDEKAIIEFFDNPTETSIEIEVLSENLKPAELIRQTRAYYEDPEKGWRVGRVMSGDQQNNKVYVRFPGRIEERLSTENIYVRWEKPVEDPSHYLAQRLSETSLFSDHRHNFMASIYSQRTASRGLSALISSQIELVPHQIQVIEKVLHDPVQKYLLADEVGLGKTIEAGVIIRQQVIDNPTNHHIVILVPPQLQLQWKEEMKTKFNLVSQLEAETVVIIPFDEPDRLKNKLPDADLIVIDEAHHIGTEEKLYKTLLANIQNIPSIILLTATPVLNNEKKYLQILNLLDPVVYSLDKIEDFREKIVRRQELASTVSQLVPSNSLILDTYVTNLKGMFPSDKILSKLCEKLKNTLSDLPDETDPDFLDQLNKLKDHVSETYRLDRRILRNRRQSVQGLTPERDGVVFLDYSSTDREYVYGRIDDWRTECMSEFYGQEDSPEYQKFSKTFVDLIEASVISKETLVKLILDRENASVNPAFASEAEWINSIQTYLNNHSIDEDRLTKLVSTLAGLINDNKVVIFCNDQPITRRVTTHLQENTDFNICEHTQDTDGGETNWQLFLNSKDHPVLVCSNIAEEGLNLQGGNKCIIHFDLPFNPNRIEQRIGRLDRFGTGKKIKSYVIRCTDDPLEMAWSEVLNTGLSVFDRSIASLQYIIEELLEEARKNLFVESVDTLNQLTENLAGDDGIVAKELTKIRNQEVLDSIEEIGEKNYEELEDVDFNWSGIQNAIQGWACKILQLRKFFDDHTHTVINYPPFFHSLNLRDNIKEVEQVVLNWLNNNPNEKFYDRAKSAPVVIGNDPDRIEIIKNEIIDHLYDEAIVPETQNLPKNTNESTDLLEYLKVMMGTLISLYGGSRRSPEQIHRFKYDHLTSLIPAHMFSSRVSRSVIDVNHRQAGNGYLTFPYTARRMSVMSRNTPNLRILRYGEELISSLISITESEDRGKSSALWRQVNNYEPENGTADVYFRCQFLVETNIVLDNENSLGNENRKYDQSLAVVLRRRGDMFFPGFYETVWLDEELNMVKETFVKENLTWQYRARSETQKQRNWDIKTDELWQNLFLKLSDHKNIWEDLVLAVPDKGKEALITKTDLPNKSNEAIKKMKVIDERRFAQLNTRIANSDNPSIGADQEALKREREFTKLLANGISNPNIKLDAITVVFLSNQDFIV